MQMEQAIGVLLHLESELAQDRGRGVMLDPEIRGPAEHQGRLEAEINTSCHLLENGKTSILMML